MGQPIRPARFAPLKSWRDADFPLQIGFDKYIGDLVLAYPQYFD
jgi:hypothetical protein